MINEIHPYYIMASFSPDGLRWTEGPNNPILDRSEDVAFRAWSRGRSSRTSATSRSSGTPTGAAAT